MRTVFRLLVGAALFGAFAVGAASAASTTPTLVPTFTVGVTFTPDTATRGQTVVATATIKNLTEAAATAKVTWQLVPPKVTTGFGPTTGHLSVPVPAGQTVSRNLTFKVPLKAPIGVYTLTINVAGATAPAIATLHVS